MDEWEQELVALGGSVRPTGPVARGVEERVRRRARRRRTRAVVGVAAAVAAVVGVAVVVPGERPDAARPVEPVTAPAPSTPATTRPTNTPKLPKGEPHVGPSIDWTSYDVSGGDGSCDQPGFYSRQPPLADRVEQEQLATQVRGAVGNGFVVRRARPSAIGVIAMIEGDLAAATYVLPAAVTVTRWYGPIESYYSAVVGVVAAAMREVPRQVDALGLDGSGGVESWGDAAAVVIRWKGPIPSEVMALTGPRDDGTVVLVEAVDHSTAELRTASTAIRRELGPGYDRVEPCDDRSGVQVALDGNDPRTDDVDTGELASDLSELAGVPVSVGVYVAYVTTG